MQLTFSLPGRTPSTNQMYIRLRNGQVRPSPAFSAYKKMAQEGLSPYEKEFAYFRDRFKPGQHVLELEMYFYIPKSEMLTKDGAIKKRRHDLDNFTKTAIDVASKALGIDDAFIVNFKAHKIPSTDWLSVFVIHRVSWDDQQMSALPLPPEA